MTAHGELARAASDGAGDRVGYWRRIFVLNCLATVVVAAAEGAFSGRTPARALARTLLAVFIFCNCIGGLCGLLLPRLLPRVRSVRFPLNWLTLVGALLVINAAGCLLALLLLALLGLVPLARVLPELWIAYTFAASFTVVFGIGGTLYQTIHAQLEQTRQALHAKQGEEERARRLAAEARLSSLESRVRPHFLFNTLNSISALVHDEPDTAERLIEQLSALLRSSLDLSDQQTIPLRQELKLVSDYLDIERARFGPRVRYSIELPEALAELEVPPFSVQPLVENAVKYAVGPRPDGATIWIRADSDVGGLAISVSDDGPGFTELRLVPGHGLDTLQARLAALFGPAAGLQVTRNGGLTRVTVRLPLRAPVAAPR